MDELRCKNIRNLSGRVLEIGPGPGTNFRCWQDHTEITEWVGVEPNENFRINETAASMNVTFPVRTVWLRGEDVDVLAESFDFVVGSHVLCSVGDVDQVLRQVRRALKPGGTYFFTEHVQAPHGLLRRAQQILEPFFFVLANGCTFRPLWESLSEETGLRGFQVHLEFLDAPMPIPFFVPHVSGWAVKYYV
ncbi:S-adenosyl-L-methionine-dependent methyltransferase [Ochromonadaceae sp. CCMP2298]|nr:S-adenosyl-L-methionine-dependent methyltransferase [Ochromonadaceae sp. CCMP2298]